MSGDFLNNSQLGKSTVYFDQYKPDILFPIPRNGNRETIGVKAGHLPFIGFDIWNGYEFSWLDLAGIPHARKIQIQIPCESMFLLESKALKLYLYSFANSKFSSEDEVKQIITRDLSKAVGDTKVTVLFTSLDKYNYVHAEFDGIVLDNLDINVTEYNVQAKYLQLEGDSEQIVAETLCSNLLKSNCPVTGHPDWGSVSISYTGSKISHAGLLKYIISFREHQEFHEHCVEQIFSDILHQCNPSELRVEARYARRGGLDINPVRALHNVQHKAIRLYRQ